MTGPATRLTPEGMRRALYAASCEAKTLGDAWEQIAILASLYPHASPSQRARIRVEATGHAGLIHRARSRQTKTVVGIYRAAEAGIDTDPDLPYAVVCEDHATCLSVATLSHARATASDPGNWCDDCRDTP